jgi:hypothetical protein
VTDGRNVPERAAGARCDLSWPSGARWGHSRPSAKPIVATPRSRAALLRLTRRARALVPSQDGRANGQDRRGDYSNALEWTRTTTGKTPHKALNPIRAPLMDPAASRSSSLCASQDASDASDGATFVRLLSRAPAGSGRSRCRCGVAPSSAPRWPPSTASPCLFEGRCATQRAMLLPFVPCSSEGRAAATLAVTRKRHRKSVLNAAQDPCCDARGKRGAFALRAGRLASSAVASTTVG